MPHLNYGILCWGHKTKKTFLLQKKALRLITNSKYNAHTDPIFKKQSLLKLHDIYNLEILKFSYNKNYSIYSNHNFKFNPTNKKIYNEIDQTLKFLKKNKM